MVRFDEMNETPKKVKKIIQIFEIDQVSRNKLESVFPPKFSEFIGHHITYAVKVPITDPLPSASSFVVVGYAIDENGLECLVVEVDGSIHRPDGLIYHITWSIDRSAGFVPKNSNDVIAANGFSYIDKPINISAKAKYIF